MEDAHRRWSDSMPDNYDRGLVPVVFAPFAKDLAARVARLGPQRVLEVGAGTGVLTAELLAAVPTAEITATDLNDAMVGLGQRRAPGARWRTADATRLPFDDASFDVVACQFSVMFFPDKPAALAEMRRVLATGGSCLVNAWGALDRHVFQAAVVDACDAIFPDDPPTFMRSVPHYYSNVDDLVADVAAAGLLALEVETLDIESPPASAAALASGYCFGTPLRAEIEARHGDLDEAVTAITAEIERRCGARAVTGGMQAHVVRAISATDT